MSIYFLVLKQGYKHCYLHYMVLQHRNGEKMDGKTVFLGPTIFVLGWVASHGFWDISDRELSSHVLVLHEPEKQQPLVGVQRKQRYVLAVPCRKAATKLYLWMMNRRSGSFED
ncbi:hypothetical protein AAHA92_13611 [Salvia divinorum]|uniref:Uncharacterized protein n=1 Tax=Salvia divinorum TaxID=28513 RepID=A0ABD1H8V7_SALDI